MLRPTINSRFFLTRMKTQATQLTPEQPTTAALPTTLRPYEQLDETTGEVRTVFKYLEGHPRQYRFDAKEGIFNINGVDKLGRSLTFQPIAWRIFTDNILNMGQKHWAELFFVDAQNCVSAVLFHGYSVDNIFKLIEPLFYDDRTLADVVITATAEKKENNKIQPKGVYYIASFSYTLAEAEPTRIAQAFVRDKKIFRQETLTDLAHFQTVHGYFNPFNDEDTGPAHTLSPGTPDAPKLIG
jgi:hypothetical protein